MQVSGRVNPLRRLSEDALAALECGDTDALLRAEHAEWGNVFVMEKGDDEDDDDDDAGSSGSGDSSEDDDAGGDDDDDDDGGSNSELERLRERMKAADRRAAKAEEELRERKKADQTDLENATQEVEELKGKLTALQSEVQTLRLNNAFLTANDQDWHDADTALALAQSKGYLEGVVDEDSGDVDKKALKKALERLAKEHQYLVKSKKKEDDEPGEPSGEPAGGRSSNNKDDKAEAQKRRQRFPVLNR